jgi:hypothetical protein
VSPPLSLHLFYPSSLAPHQHALINPRAAPGSLPSVAPRLSRLKSPPPALPPAPASPTTSPNLATKLLRYPPTLQASMACTQAFTIVLGAHTRTLPLTRIIT